MAVVMCDPMPRFSLSRPGEKIGINDNYCYIDPIESLKVKKLDPSQMFMKKKMYY